MKALSIWQKKLRINLFSLDDTSSTVPFSIMLLVFKSIFMVSYPFLYRVWGRPDAPAAPHRPRLCIVHLGHTPLFLAGSSNPSRLLQRRDQGGCRQTSSHRAGTEAHHRDKVPSVPVPRSGNGPFFYCDLSRI